MGLSSINYKSVILRTLALSLFALVCVAVFGGSKAFAYTRAEFQAFYGNVPHRLPDDDYKLTKDGTNDVGSTLNCVTKWGCSTLPGSTNLLNDGQDANSHQYITLSNDTINDDSAPSQSQKFRYAHSAEFTIYTTSPNDPKDLSISIVDRGVGPSLACRNTVEYFYYDNSSTIPLRQGSVTFTDSDCPGVNRGLLSFPAGSFTQLQDPNTKKNMGIYAARIVVKYADSNAPRTQTSFHISASGARLGYLGSGAVGGEAQLLPGVRPDEQGWVNVYATNYAKDNNINFYFRAPCNAGNKTITLEWDDGNQSRSTIQNTSAKVVLYRFHPGNINTREIVATYNAIGDNYNNGRSYTMETYGNNLQYAYMVQFQGIDGGNGISFRTPYNAADSRIPCDETQVVAPDSTCNRFEHNLGDHSIYRFTAFSRNQNYVASSPAENSLVDGSGNHGAWKTFNAAPDYQPAEKNSNGVTNPYGFDYPAAFKGPDRLVYIERWDHVDANSNGTIDWQYTSGVSLVSDCFRATPVDEGVCSLTLIDGSIPGDPNGVKGGSTFTVTGSITNSGKGDLPENINGVKLGLTIDSPDWNGGKYYTNTGILRGQSAGVTITLVAPSDISARTLSVHPEYSGVYNDLGPSCSIPINVYQPYEFTASASTSLDNKESPRQAVFNTSVTQVRGTPIPATVRRVFYKNNTEITRLTDSRPPSPPGSFGDAIYNLSTGDYVAIAPGTYKLADVYCVGIVIDNGFGWQGPGGLINLRSAGANDCDDGTVPSPGGCVPESSCCTPGSICGPATTIPNKPYVKVYGGDVAAGGGFEGDCGAAISKIETYLYPLKNQVTDNRSGSGTQLAAFSLAGTSGFMTASLREVSPRIPRDLTFAHRSADPFNDLANDPLLGTGMSGDGWCVPDYYQSTQYSDAARNASSNIGTFNLDEFNTVANDNKQTHFTGTPGSKVILNGGAAFTKHHTLYVNGDVYIAGNVAYTAAYGTTTATIPSFALIVKGNIFISKDVSQLDGLYVAQPDTGRTGVNTGRIYTCAEPGGNAPVIDPVGLFNLCGAAEAAGDANSCELGAKIRQLTVNGAFIAQKVMLNRTGYSLRNSCANEKSEGSKAAEVFNFSPEIYMSPPVFKPKSTQTSGDYQYLSILAPFL